MKDKLQFIDYQRAYCLSRCNACHAQKWMQQTGKVVRKQTVVLVKQERLYIGVIMSVVPK
jgi:uncharacterized protein YuzB (UPF0349 family)